MSLQHLQVVFFGDSMTWSSRSPYGKRYVDFTRIELQKILGKQWQVDVAACGEGGNTAPESLIRMNRDVLAYHPQIVVINLGANDMVRLPSRRDFMQALTAMVKTLKSKTKAIVVLETLPGINEKQHALRNEKKFLTQGGLNASLEKYSHSFIRKLASQNQILLHDRYHILSQGVRKNPRLMSTLILPDGIHLTPKGDHYFAITLGKLLKPHLKKWSPSVSDGKDWLQKAEKNQEFIHCLERLKTGELEKLLLPSLGPAAVRLPLQQAWSFAFRAGSSLKEPDLLAQALLIERLSAGFLALQRMLTKPACAHPKLIPDTLAWGLRQLKPIRSHPDAKKLIQKLKGAAHPKT